MALARADTPLEVSDVPTREQRTIFDRLRLRSVRAGLTPLQGLRLVVLIFAVLNAVMAIPIVILGSRSAGFHIPQIVAALFLCSCWIWGYQKHLSSYLDIPEAVALVVIGLGAGRPIDVIGLFYAAVLYRSLFGSRLLAIVRVVILGGAFAVIVMASASPELVGDLIPYLVGLMFTAAMTQMVAETLTNHGRALTRERILRQLGGMLGRFRDERTMYDSVLAALHALVTADPTARVSIARGSAREMAAVAVAGAGAEEIRKGLSSMSELPPPLLDALLASRVLRLTQSDAVPLPMNFIRKAHVVIAPLVVTGQLVGVLTIGSDVTLPADFDEVLTILASQVSMWMEAQGTDQLLREKDRERTRLLRHLVIAQEDERKLIAGDIHDDSIQEMAAVAIRLGMLRKHLTNAGALETLTKIEGSVTSSIARLRSLMFSLRPPSLDEGGLAPALREQLTATAEECSFKWTLTSDITIEPPIEVRVPAFRIAQEAIANVRKHANAKNVAINIEIDDVELLVTVRDDGVGFSPEERKQEVGHLGITSMRERAEICGGKYSITSAPGEGTNVEFSIPATLDREKEEVSV